jgi:hypothetical protein
MREKRGAEGGNSLGGESLPPLFETKYASRGSLGWVGESIVRQIVIFGMELNVE